MTHKEWWSKGGKQVEELSVYASSRITWNAARKYGGTRSTGKQQLQTKISALCNKADKCLSCGMSLDAIIPILRSMRKLSVM